MEPSYVLILLVLLIIVLVGVVFFGYRQLTQVSVIVNQHSSAIGSLREFLNRMLTVSDDALYHTPMMQVVEQNLHQGLEDGEAGDQEEDEHELTEAEKNIEEQIEKEEEATMKDKSKDIQPPMPPTTQTPAQIPEQTSSSITEQIVAQPAPSDEKKDDKPEEKKEEIKVEDISIDTSTKPAATTSESSATADEVKTIEIKGKEPKNNKVRFPPNSPKDLAVGTVQEFEGKVFIVYDQQNGVRRWRQFKP